MTDVQKSADSEVKLQDNSAPVAPNPNTELQREIMSQLSDVTFNGSAQNSTIRPDVQEGVKILPGTNNNSAPPQQYVANNAPPQQINDNSQRPPLRRVDSRNTLPYRPAGPYANQPIPQGAVPQGNIARPPIQNRPPPPSGNQYAQRPLVAQPPRFPTQQLPQRFNPPEKIIQNNQNSDTIRRPVNSIPEGVAEPQKFSIQQRPLQPVMNQSGPRNPGVGSRPSSAGSGDRNDSTEQLYKHPVGDSTENIQNRIENENAVKEIQQPKNQPIKNNMNTNISEDEVRHYRPPIEVADSPRRAVESSLIRKTPSRESITRPHDSNQMNMNKTIRSSQQSLQDDDDAVITPSSDFRRDNIYPKIESPDIKPIQKNTSNEINQEKRPANSNSNIPISNTTPSNSLINNRPSLQDEPKHYQPTKYQESPKNTLEPKTIVQPTEIINSKPNLSQMSESSENDNDVITAPYAPTVNTTRSKIISEPNQRFVENPKTLPSPIKKMNPIEHTQEKHISRPITPSREKSPLMSNSKNDSVPKSLLTTKENKPERKLSPRPLSQGTLNRRSPGIAKSEGDNDSGVDETTQGHEQSCNSDSNSPKKSQKPGQKTPSKCKTPVKTSPDSNNSMSIPPIDKKKVPMNKVHVGGAPSPNLKTVKSKIGSLDNATYKPGGGHVKIENKKLDFTKASPRIAAKNDAYTPTGGDKKIIQQKLQWNAKSKIGSLDNATYKPKTSEKKIETVKLDFKEKAKSKVGSKDNLKHVPGGGDVKIDTKKLDIKAQSKIGSLDNVKHKPGGGDIKIFDDKDYLKQRASSSAEHSALSGSQNSLRSQPEPPEPISDENLNQER